MFSVPEAEMAVAEGLRGEWAPVAPDIEGSAVVLVLERMSGRAAAASRRLAPDWSGPLPLAVHQNVWHEVALIVVDILAVAPTCHMQVDAIVQSD